MTRLDDTKEVPIRLTAEVRAELGRRVRERMIAKGLDSTYGLRGLVVDEVLREAWGLPPLKKESE